MLSILIPTYNYNTLKLVKNLQLQGVKSNINFEILVLDDASNDAQSKVAHEKISTLDYCSFFENKKNIGRT
ncbi:glycosyltransferase, partial [bacterium]|nr:glycosyltransferase [bacterium]